MKKLLIATLFTLPVQAATVMFEDGSQVEVPDDWAWSIKMQVKAPPKHCPPNGKPPACPPNHCPPVECPPPPPPVECPTICEIDPYYRYCPLRCDGPTPGDKCKRQRPPFED